MPSRPLTRPHLPLTKTSNVTTATTASATTRQPLKRPATTLTSVTNPTISKFTKPTTSKPIKAITNIAARPAERKQTAPNAGKTTIRPKAAPYDFKTKFNYVKEDYDKLKIEHRDLKEKHIAVADQNEELLVKNDSLQNDLDSVKLHLKSNSEELDKIRSGYDTLIDTKQNLQTENDKLHADLDATRVQLKLKTNKLEVIEHEFDEMKRALIYKSRILEESKDLIETMKEQLITFERKQREMHNIIQELKGNIRVFCRIRPPLYEESHKVLSEINYVDEKTIELLKNDKKSEFSFDKVFGPNAMQEDIFEELSQLVQSALDGYNVCIFAYGQTGSGKTYTMDGIRTSSHQLGMIPRSVDHIFKEIKELDKLGWNYIVKTSFLEIYNENIVDLLDPARTQLDIRMVDSKSNDVYVANLSIIEVQNADDLKYHLHEAQKNRATAATENNERSSRSHSVTKIILEGFNKDRNEKCAGSLNLVDLAGSEKFYTNDATRLRETTNINKSLSNLSNVILALVRKTGHVPYRNSKLTHLLMPCLGGNSKTLMLVNISPLEDCYNESVNSLRFATTVNQCKTGSIKKIKTLQLNGLRSENSFCK